MPGDRGNPHRAWMDAFFASYYRHRPVNASFIGCHEWDAELPDFSDSAAGDALADMQDLLRRADDIDPASLTPIETIDHRAARGFLEIQVWEYQSQHFHRGNPSLYTGEAIFGFLAHFLTEYAPLSERVESAAARIDAIPGFLAQCRENIGAAPCAWTARAVRECDGAIALFTEGVEALCAEQGISDCALTGPARRAARAFADLRAYLQSDLLPAGERAAANGRYACGEEALDLYLRRGHFLAESADEIVEYARDHLAKAHAYSNEHAADFNARTPREALDGLADLHPDADGYYDRYQEIWHEVRTTIERSGLLAWPDFPIRYVPRPAWVRSAVPHLYFLFYRSPAAFQRPPVHDHLVAPLDRNIPADDQRAFLRANNDSVIKLNHVVHHGGPGHHVQNWHAYRSESRIGQVAAVDCASRIAMFCGGTMAEGWACYATDLAAQAGALSPLERYATMNARTRMAARAIVDVRLHQGRLSLDEAADFYCARAGMGRQAAIREAEKNSMFPGAAVMYLMGTDAIHSLRAAIARREGETFDVLGFHERLLAYGSVPVALIAESWSAAPIS